MITVFIPTFNEEENISRIAEEVVPVLKKLRLKYEILIVDDGSRDTTVEKVLELSKKIKEIRLIAKAQNSGLGNAIREGINNAKGEIFIPLDADLTFSPEYIPEMLSEFHKGKYDCINGSPLLKKNTAIPFHRYALTKIITFVYGMLLGVRINTITGIFRLYKTEQLKKMKLTSGGYEINSEIMINLLQQHRKVREIFVPLEKRKYGKSKMNLFREGMNHLRLVRRLICSKISKAS